MKKLLETIMRLVKLTSSHNTDPRELPQVKEAKDMHMLVLKTWDMDTIKIQQEVKLILLNQNGQVLKIVPLFKGGLTETLVDPRIIFITALAGHAASIILVTNRVSGNLRASSHDCATAERLLNAGKLLGIKLLDFILISPYAYNSFAENGTI